MGCGQGARMQEWAVLLGGGTVRPPLSYLQQCGIAGKSLYRAHRAAGRGSLGMACLCCWALLSSPALCLDPVLQHHWWRCKWESRSAATSLKGQMLFFRIARESSVSFQKTLQSKRKMGIVSQFCFWIQDPVVPILSHWAPRRGPTGPHLPPDSVR